MRFIRDVLAVAIGVVLGFGVVVHTHELIDVVYAVAQMYDLSSTPDNPIRESQTSSARTLQ